MDAMRAVIGYLENLATGIEPAGEAMKLAAERSLDEIHGACSAVAWDHDELQRVADFVAGLTLHDWRGVPGVLLPWQLHLAGCLLARRRQSDGEPATRSMVLEVGKGNAKSTTAAMLCLYLLSTSTDRIELWSLATKRDQAHRIIENAANFARGRSDLVHPGGPLQLKQWEILHRGNRSVMGSVATKESTADGLLGRLYLADECGRFRTGDRTLDKLGIALHKRPDSQLLMFTTPGQERTNSYYRRRDSMEVSLRQGELPIDQVALLYGIDANDSAFGEEGERNWPKANPMIGCGVMGVENIRTLSREAGVDLASRSEFVREVGCRFDDRAASFIDVQIWDQCREDFDPLEISKGRQVFAGLDLSKRHDLTAVVFACLNDAKDTVYLWGHSWTCEHEIETRERMGNMPYRQWSEAGAITICQGNTIDLDTVGEYLKQSAATLDLREINFDPVSGSSATLEQWRQAGLPMENHRQGRLEMSPPLQNLYTRTASIGTPSREYLKHNGCPVLRQSIRNARISTDYADSPVAEKDKAAGRIDALVAATMALTGIARHLKSSRSFYETSTAI